MKTKILGLLALGLLAGPMVAQASYLYTFESTGTSTSVSFTVADIFTTVQDPLSQLIGQTYGGLTIADAAFGPSDSSWCLAISGSAGGASLSANSCSHSSSGALSQFTSPTAVGVYNAIVGFSNGVPVIDRLTISQVPDSTVPEPGTLALLGLGLAGLGLSRRKAN